MPFFQTKKRVLDPRIIKFLELKVCVRKFLIFPIRQLEFPGSGRKLEVVSTFSMSE